MRKLVSLAITLVVVLMLVNASAPRAYAQSSAPSVYDFIAGRKDLSTLAAALKAAGVDSFLVYHGPFTVFAPNDDAFAAFLKANNTTADKLLADKATLLQVLLYHVSPGLLGSAALSGLLTDNGGTIRLATLHGTDPLTITIKDGGGLVNDSKFLEVDHDGALGTVHIIDKVLLPPIAGTYAKASGATKNFMDAASGESNLSTFLAAAKAFSPTIGDDIISTTIFAPTDDAFKSLFKDLGTTPDQLLADRKTLSRVLRYHLIPWIYTSDLLARMDGVLIGTSVADSTVKVKVVDGKVMINGANVVKADVAGTNQVTVHVIDQVLRPPVFGSAATPAATATK